MKQHIIQGARQSRNASGSESARSKRPSGTINFFDRFGHTPLRGLPKYAQLREAMMAAIDSGYWTLGEKLPTEAELVRCTPFSLGTVQRALRSLVEEGFITRAQGSGTYVSDSRQRMEAPWHCRFLNDDGSGFLPVFPKLVVRKRVKRHGPWSAYIDSGNGEVIQIDRRLGIDDEFFVYSRLFMSAPRFGRLLNKSIKEIEGANLKTLIRRDFHLPITQIGQRISMAHFPDDVCRVIKVAAGTLGTIMEGVAMAGTRVNVYYQQLYIPPNDKRLIVSDSAAPWFTPAGAAAMINE